MGFECLDEAFNEGQGEWWHFASLALLSQSEECAEMYAPAILESLHTVFVEIIFLLVHSSTNTLNDSYSF
jgi:hypothetical protein